MLRSIEVLIALPIKLVASNNARSKSFVADRCLRFVAAAAAR